MDWLSLLPPVLSIGIALLTRKVFWALIIGIIAGCLQLAQWHIIDAVLNVLIYFKAVYVEDGWKLNSANVMLLLFSLFTGVMVAVLSSNGSMYAVVEKLSKKATNKKKSLLLTWGLGVGIFFDDYANTLIVGNTVRPLTDRFGVSREKLAYIVDSTAAPMASIALVSTWIGFELGQIQTGMESIGLKMSAYSLFIKSLNYSFYPILTLVFIVMLIAMNKDFGAMYHAERKAMRANDFNESNSTQTKSAAWQAVVPILSMLVITFGLILYTGMEPGEAKSLSKIIGDADSYVALFYGSLTGMLLAIVLSFFSAFNAKSLLTGSKQMLEPLAILVLAWMLGSVIKDLGTGNYIAGILGDQLEPWAIGGLLFVVSALISFSTGTSFGTMAILYPIAMKLTWSICESAGLSTEDSLPVLAHAVSVVLAGAVFGDHCSPISDTTILSSMATKCNHINHVRTQLPYALTVAVVSVLLSLTAVPLGLPAVVNLLIGTIILFAVIRFFGKTVDDRMGKEL